jgi:hypothetical protein
MYCGDVYIFQKDNNETTVFSGSRLLQSSLVRLCRYLCG